MSSPTLSVVVPCFNEAECIRETHRHLIEVLSTLGHEWEIIYVNDGSKDETLDILINLISGSSSIRVISFSRNFGHQTAVTAGIDYAKGEAVVLIDADLQDPPELIPEMILKWQEGFDVVYGQRRTRKGETPFKKISAKLFYRLINSLSEVPIPLDTGDFRLIDRRVVDVLGQMPERSRFIRGMVSWAGFRQTPILYDRSERFAGESKYPLRKMIKFGLDGVLSFSIQPLKLATSLGGLVSACSALGIIYALTLRLFTKDWVSGWTLLMISVLFLGGVQLVFLGVIGEYVGRIYAESKGRPQYVIGYDSEEPSANRRQVKPLLTRKTSI